MSVVVTPVVEIQSDSTATDLENIKVPNGQTIKSYLNNNIVKKMYFTGTTSAAGNFNFVNLADWSKNLIIAVTARYKNSTSTLCVCSPYQYSTAAWGTIQGCHFTNEAATADVVANTLIEGYIFYIPIAGF